MRDLAHLRASNHQRLFAAEKRGEVVGPDDGRCRQRRVIINMVPSNILQHAVPGDLALLPTTAQLNSLQLEHLEVLLLSSSDRRCFFCLFLMEPCWRGPCRSPGPTVSLIDKNSTT